MMADAYANARRQWAASRRLRVACLVIALMVVLHGVFAIADRRAAVEERYRQDAQLLQRLEAARTELEWPERAAEATEALAQMRSSVPAAQSAGLAQAEVQAWLNSQAQSAGLEGMRARAEPVADVPGRAELWQVIARLDAEATPQSLENFARNVAAGLPWVQVERLEISGQDRLRVVAVVRAYFQRPSDLEALP